MLKSENMKLFSKLFSKTFMLPLTRSQRILNRIGDFSSKQYSFGYFILTQLYSTALTVAPILVIFDKITKMY